MKKTMLTSLTILCLLLTLPLLGCKTSAKASTNTIYVPTDYPTIQEAINHANSGDTIFVHNRTYYEHVIINKSLSLVGENRDSTIVDGEGTGSVIRVAANNVNISNFTIQRSGIGERDEGGIFVDRSGGNKISHNIIKNSSNGISLYHSVRNTVFSNTALRNKYGISLYSSNKNEIYGNNASHNSRYGIALFSSDENKISSNNASSNRINGIHLHSSSDNIISSTTASSNNFDGIRLDFSTNNMVSANTISNNDYGIRLDASSDNLVSRNTASNNYFGIYLHSSSNNTIHHNNFNDINQTWSDSVNIWDDGDEGNYWRDYNGTDANQNGIGDTSYKIDVDNIDRFPLMGMFSDYSVTSKEEEYHVTTICNSIISEFRFEIGLETGNRIIRFNVTGKDGTAGFCRIMTPIKLMNYSLIVLVDGEEIIPTILDDSNKTHTYLYFTYLHSSHTITIISSKLQYLYHKLLNKYAKLQTDFHSLNSTYHKLLGNYSQLLEKYSISNASYQHLLDYSELLGNHTSLLLEHEQNIRGIMYVFIATTTIFIIAAVYLSRHTHKESF